jgi:threonine dehydratase
VAHDYIERILKARVYEVVEESPLDLAPRLSEALGNRVWLKREDVHSIFSFKLRGAYNKIAQLTDAQCARGVVAASAGNHAQGVAVAAAMRGMRAVIVMPVTTPEIKVEAVRARGAEVKLVGDRYEDALVHARAIAESEGLVLVHPYDDPDIIAGQGTIAMEILRQLHAPLDAVFVPVGGGGLIAGIAVYVKYLYPEVKVIGVEPTDASCMHAALAKGARVELDTVGTFADGVAVRQVGEEPFRLAQRYVDEVLLVDTDEICAAMKDIFEATRSVPEPAGALGLAGLKRYVRARGVHGQNLVAIESGANMNFDRLRFVAERAEIGERREALLSVKVPEEPGSFLAFCGALGPRPLTEFNYRYRSTDAAHVFVGVGLEGKSGGRAALVEALGRAGYEVTDMTDDDLAALHVRFMVGGRCPGLEDERLLRFVFPEKPGALLEFMRRIGSRWNLSLFHYRNHGDAYGRVLIGVQVPDAELEGFFAHVRRSGYPHVVETENPAYQLFLK